MTTTVKSTSITNLDATPAVQNTSGEGGKGYVKNVSDSATAVVSDGVTLQIIKMVRIPTTAKVKTVHVECAALTKGSFDVGLYYSSSARDGTAAASQGTVVNSKSALFATAVDFSSALGRTDVTNESGSYTADLRVQPIWKAAGLTVDPGGYFDVVLTQTAITVTAGGLTACEVGYVE